MPKNSATNDYFFVISIPKDELIEYTTKLNSYIAKFFPDKKVPCNLKPLEVKDKESIAKITINASEEDVLKFAKRFFGENFELIERESGEIEISPTAPPEGELSEEELPDETIVKH